MCLFLSKKLASDSLFVEKINSLNTNEDEIIKNFLNEFLNHQKKWKFKT